MKIMIIGRTYNLLNTAKYLSSKGHEITGVITSKAAPDYKVDEKDYELFAKSNEIPFRHTPNLKIEDLKRDFSMNRAEIAVSINYTGIISQDIIDFFPYGILNLHGGDLPRYRGNACQAWALINGEDRIGVCVHKMIGGELDSGDIIARGYIDVSMNSRIGEVYDQIETITPQLVESAIKKLHSNKNYVLEKQSKIVSDSLRCYPRLPDDGKVDWNKSNVEILRLINASSEPYSGAFSFLDGEKIIFWRAKICKDNSPWLGVPGQVSEINQDGSINILCLKGKIKITEIKYRSEVMRPGKVIRSIRKRFSHNTN